MLVPVGGRPMLDRLIDLYRPWVGRIVLVVSPGFADAMRTRAFDTDIPIDIEVQERPTGMLDAVMLARERVQQSTAS
jgi:dTDP-glucose pyrophosphorylase